MSHAPTSGRIYSAQIQENLIAYFRLFADLPGFNFMDNDVVWSINVDGAPGNHVLRAQLSSNTIEQRLDEIFAQIHQYTDQIDWLVFPNCQPADLGQRLEARGLIGGSGGTWMLADLTIIPAIPADAKLPEHFRIEYVHDLPMLAVWSHISAAGFGAETQVFYDAYARHIDDIAISLHAIGYLHDQPVTSSTLILAGGIVGIYDVSTPPALRGRGFGSAITREMMQEANRRGYRYAWIWASEMGKSVYQKLGFVMIDVGVREYRLLSR